MCSWKAINKDFSKAMYSWKAINKTFYRAQNLPQLPGSSFLCCRDARFRGVTLL